MTEGEFRIAGHQPGVRRRPRRGRAAQDEARRAFAEAIQRADAVTQVSGGVGPETIAMLMQNTRRAAPLRPGRTPSF